MKPNYEEAYLKGREVPHPSSVAAERVRLFSGLGIAASALYEEQVSKLVEFVAKTTSPCNLACGSAETGRGYECYEYVDDSWRDLPKTMSYETVGRLGDRIGEYSAANGLKSVGVLFHGGEPLFMSNPRAEEYYDVAAPLLRAAIAEHAPNTTVKLSMQTNGTLLRPTVLETLKRHNIAVGVSLDGSEVAHNRNRVMKIGDRRVGTFKLVERGIAHLRQQCPELYQGLLAVIDLRNDPIEVYDALAELDPPAIDFLLPYGTWDNPPPGLTTAFHDRSLVEPMRMYHRAISNGEKLVYAGDVLSDTQDMDLRQHASTLDTLVELMEAPHGTEQLRAVAPYANWLLQVEERNQQRRNPIRIRYLESIEQLSKGGASSTEALGLYAGGEVVVRTDGSYELPDSLKASYEGAPHLDMNVAGHSVEEVADIMRAAGHLGRKALATECLDCPVLSICGGGHIATRYSQARGFTNPSVYCYDLEVLASRIGESTARKDEYALVALANAALSRQARLEARSFWKRSRAAHASDD